MISIRQEVIVVDPTRLFARNWNWVVIFYNVKWY